MSSPAAAPDAAAEQMSPAEAEVWETIRRMNRVWTVEGRPELLRDYFHPTMVAIDPVNPRRTEGGEAAVAGWTGFVNATTIHHWTELEPRVRLYGGGDFAVVTYYYDMSYDMDGRTVKTAGRDMFALVREEGRWWVVADQFSPFPGVQA